MSLTASMWTSVSGLLAHGEKMNSIGNNISNVNTVGFKGQRMDFMDFVYQSMGTASGTGQVGRGTSVGAIMNDFSQGGYESSTNPTDLLISGNGFFGVKPEGSNSLLYTRAGNFRFKADGTLADPNGYALQGHKINPITGSPISGVVEDVKLDTFTCPPKHTTAVRVPVNLRNSKVAEADDLSRSTDGDAFFSVLKNWDARQEPPLGELQYAYQSTIEVYDEAGKMHTLTVYFDRVANGNPEYIDGFSTGESYWEYVVTMDPADDVRDFSSTYDAAGANPTDPDVPEKLKGLLGAGTLTFSSNGNIKDMTAFVPHTDGSAADHWWTTDAITGETDVNLDKWIAAPMDDEGYPMFAPNFSGTAGLSQAYEDGTWDSPNVNATGRMISLNLGLRSTTQSWNFLPDANGALPDTYGTTGLVMASSISDTMTVHAQRTGAFNDWYQWDGVQNTSRPAGGGAPTNVTILSKDPTIPGTYGPTWKPAVPPNNGNTFNWQFTVPNSVPAAAMNVVTSKDIPGLSTAGITFERGANPDNSTARGWEAVGQPNVTAVIRRDNATDQAHSPDTFQKEFPDFSTWTKDTTSSPGEIIYTSPKNGANGYAVITVPDTMTDAQIAALDWTDQITAAAQTAMGATLPTNWYWDMKVPNGKPNSTIPVTTSTDVVPTLPAGAIAAAANPNNVTEYYFVNEANPNIAMVTDSVSTVFTEDTDGVGGPDRWTPVTVTNWAVNATPKMASAYGSNKYFLNGMDGSGELQTIATTTVGDDFYAHSGRSQDGYTFGNLMDVNVTAEGMLSATYSNGETLELFQLLLFDFPSTQNLRREGNNLFSETRESGVPSQGAPGTSSFGTVESYAIEQSNVDLSREFVNMITTQRGFQANSKSVTTVDTMLETVINMKR